jgi:hypothetical protein
MSSIADFGQRSQEELIRQIVRRAGSSTYDAWWSRVASAGYCSAPIHLASADGKHSIYVRCKNRRSAVCPACSDLYAGDTWQLVHAGLNGGHEVPQTVVEHPAVFCTVTAPGFGTVHSASKHGAPEVCRRGPNIRCEHGVSQRCELRHDLNDRLLGQPLCMDCYDYLGQALFTWHAPELWARFATTLRRQVRRESRLDGTHEARASFVKIVEMQRRGVPHFHFVVRLDEKQPAGSVEPVPPQCNVTSQQLADLVLYSATIAHLDVLGSGGQLVQLRFGEQIDTQPLDSTSGLDDQKSAGRVAGYLAKYVTKSVADFGVSSRRVAPHVIDDLELSDHVKRLLHSVVRLSVETDQPEMLNWLHTLGYRGHVSSKSRKYSTTMGALRSLRAEFQRQHVAPAGTEAAVETEWEFTKSGHATLGDRFLATSKALQEREARWARIQLADDRREEP